MKRRKLAGLGIIAGVIGTVAFSVPSSTPDVMTLKPESQLWISGKSTVRDWKCKSTQIDATIDAAGPSPVGAVLGGEIAVKKVKLVFPTAKLDCANGTMNEHMLKALKAKDNPTIFFEIESYDLSKDVDGQHGTLKGELTIGGTAKPISVNVTFTAAPDGALRVVGTHEVHMKEFGLTPPSLMLGTMKVNELVIVGFDLLLKS
jgi:autotransporter translocation and assembly factor TamB